jgi:hypothetical protein
LLGLRDSIPALNPMIRLRPLVLSFALAHLFAVSVNATVLFVSPKGQAGAVGNQVAQLATLAEAVERAQAGDTIRLAGGTYQQGPAIRLEKSGTVTAPIRIERTDGPESPHFLSP